ncbi:MAG: ribonuclease Y [Verrucomicrobia bacterium]|nr:ribonuclease Y [Verrucomicrobiota bacterium]
MILLAQITWEHGVALAAGLALGYAFFRWKESHRRAALQLQEQALLERARSEADSHVRKARLDAEEEMQRFRRQAEASFADRLSKVTADEQRLSLRESQLSQESFALTQRAKAVEQQGEIFRKQEAALEGARIEAEQLSLQRKEQLQRIAHLSAAEARAQFMKEVELEALQDANDLTRHIVEDAQSRAEAEATRIITIAIQRYAADSTFEATTATIALEGDEIKGRIIGREGRNIRAFEAATGVTVLIDDTPNAVVLSSFDPVRREVAREAMQRLILDGRIHPTRIEEVVMRVNVEMDETIVKAGENAVFRAGLPPMHPEIVKVLGRLRFRQSYAQNILDHSVEVAHLVGLMAAELGLDATAGRRAGLLHDIGKAMNHEVEGSHAIIGADFVRRHGESEDVVNGVASHHDEIPHTCLWGILVSAADAISASRPGARSETMTTYLKRLENLEKIGLSFAGVEKCFAVQAGRELRVMVQPDTVNDLQAAALARNITRKIEDELQYPGQIRVTVIRETRVVEFAK